MKQKEESIINEAAWYRWIDRLIAEAKALVVGTSSRQSGRISRRYL
jgi:hypothetical protein